MSCSLVLAISVFFQFSSNGLSGGGGGGGGVPEEIAKELYFKAPILKASRNLDGWVR